MVNIGPEGAYPIIMFLYGLGTFVSGGILKFRPLVWGAVGAWATGIAALFVTFQHQLILLAISVLVSYLIPGYLLSKSQQHV
jgi:membrane protein implicated in regulation of membrane protease activity